MKIHEFFRNCFPYVSDTKLNKNLLFLENLDIELLSIFSYDFDFRNNKQLNRCLMNQHCYWIFHSGKDLMLGNPEFPVKCVPWEGLLYYTSAKYWAADFWWVISSEWCFEHLVKNKNIIIYFISAVTVRILRVYINH